jgi:hypothetical protein
LFFNEESSVNFWKVREPVSTAETDWSSPQECEVQPQELEWKYSGGRVVFSA